MKRNIIIIIIFSFFLPNENFSQIVLKKKEVSEKLNLILLEIEEQNFENALNIFYCTNNIIKIENVRKREIGNYNRIKTTLDQKLNEFETIDKKINELIKSFYRLDFEESFELLEIFLTKENSLIKTRNLLKEIYPKLEKSKEICDKNKNNIKEWNFQFDNENYESIFFVLDISNTTTNCFYSRDYELLKKLKKDLNSIYTSYNSLRNTTISNANQTIKDINHQNIDFEKSEILMALLNSHINEINEKSKDVKGNNPILQVEIDRTLKNLNVELIKIHTINESLRPKTLKEKEEFISNEDFKLSIEQILNNFQNIYDLIPKKRYFSSIEEFGKMVSIYNLDVIGFYDLGEEYNSDLKVKLFKESDEYKNLISQLKKKKEILTNTYFYINGKSLNYSKNNYQYSAFGHTPGGEGFSIGFLLNFEKSIGNYNLNKKSIDINIGSVTKYNCNPEKTIWFIKFPSLKVNKIYWHKNTRYYQILDIYVNEETGLKIENNKDDISVLMIFKIEDLIKERIVHNQGILSCNTTHELLTTNQVRFILYNEKNFDIYYDKIY